LRLVDKYRPKTFEEIVGQDHILPQIRDIVERGIENAPHMLFSGPAGTGKTTTAMVIARSWFGRDWRRYFIELNASDERGITTIREKVKKFALASGWKIIFLDEADSMTSDAQNALRRIMERATQTVFILSCNWEWKIIDPIKSRTAIFRFRRLSDRDVLRKLLYIVKAEKVKISDKNSFKKAMILLVKQANGDLRKAINMLDTIITNGKTVNVETVLALRDTDIVVDALQYALSGKFDEARKMIEDALIEENMDWRGVVEKLYRAIESVDIDDVVRARLFVRLSDVETRISNGASPVLQLVGFIAYAWVAQYIRRDGEIND